MQILRHHARALLRPAAARLTAGPALPLHRRLAALDRRRVQPAVQHRRHRLVARDDPQRRRRSIRRCWCSRCCRCRCSCSSWSSWCTCTPTASASNSRQTFAAAIAGLALAHTIGRAVLKGLVTRNEPFFRTPEARRRRIALLLGPGGRLRGDAADAGAVGVAIGIRTRCPRKSPARICRCGWSALLIQSIPYTAALLVSLASALQTAGLAARNAACRDPGCRAR